MDDSARVKSLREHDELKVDAAYAHYSTALDLVLSSLHAEEQARRLQRKLEAGGEQRRTIGCRAEAASRARAIENYVEPGQTAAPWEWLPPFDPGLPASAMERALTAQLQRSAHFHASSCDTMLGEAGACPAIVATQRKEQERALRVGAWEVRTAAAAECGTSAVYAAALAQRDAALAAMAQEARAEQLSEREGLAAFREKERLAKLQAAERERLREELADRKAQREADSVVVTPRHAGHASPSRAAVREGLMAQLEEKERLGSEEKQRERRLDAGMLGFSLAARLLE